MTLREKLLILFKSAYEEEKYFHANLDENEISATGKLERWSAKDIMAHLMYWKECVVPTIAATLQNKNTDIRRDVDAINEEVFKTNENKSWDDVMADFERVHKSFVECVETIPDEMLVNPDTLPWQEGKLLWRIIVGNGYMHPIEHLSKYYFDRGDSNYAVKLHEQSATLSGELSDNPEWLGTVTYNLACGYAIAGQHRRAINELVRAFKLNPGLVEWSKIDTDLDSLRKHNEYKSLY